MLINKNIAASAVLLTTLVGCGGGGGATTGNSGGGGGGGGAETDVVGLEMPTQVSVVTAAEEGATADAKSQVSGLKTNMRSLATMFDDAGTDYTDDHQNAHVYDRSLEPLSMVNQILCYVDQTAADQMVNQGAYTALINGTKCENGESSGNSDTGQSSGQSTEYKTWTVVSTRASDSAPQITKFWFNENGNDHPMTIMGEITITEGVSDTHPFGKFALNFKGTMQQNGNSIDAMSGTLRTKDNAQNNPEFVLYINEGDVNLMGEGGSKAADVQLSDVDGTSGKALVSSTRQIDCSMHGDRGECQSSGETGILSTTEAYNVSFNADNFLNGVDDGSGVVSDQQCRSRSDFDTHVWRYNLYNKTTGARVELNSGFPIRFSIGGIQHNGFAGYWGLWTDGIDPNNITTVTRENHQDGETEQQTYDVFHAPGKLIKSVRTALPLSGLDGETFDYWDQNDHSNYIVEYTTDTSLSTDSVVAEAGFYKTHSIMHNPGSERTLNQLGSPVQVTDHWLNLWSQSLGGRVSYTDSDANNLTVFRESTVTSDDEAFASGNTLTLYCYGQCLKAGITQNQIDYQSDTPYLSNSNNVNAPAATYTFGKSDLTLKIGSTAVAFNTGVEPSPSSPSHWGIQTGAMVADYSSLTNAWDTWNQEVTYRWETGSNNWNQLTALRDPTTHAFVSFDQPMRFRYVHSSENERGLAVDEISDFANRTFMLEYGGGGSLWGIPSARSEDHNRYYALFSLKDGVTLSDGSMDYVVKAIDMEQSMKQEDVSVCTSAPNNLSLDNLNLTLPTANDIGAISITVDDEPTIDSTPAVVEGEVVNDASP